MIQRYVRGKELSTRWVRPDKLAPRHLKDKRVKEILEAMQHYPDAVTAIIENSRRVIRVIPMNVSGTFRPRTELPSK